jgi:hypothetical protein
MRPSKAPDQIGIITFVNSLAVQALPDPAKLPAASSRNLVHEHLNGAPPGVREIHRSGYEGYTSVLLRVCCTRKSIRV